MWVAIGVLAGLGGLLFGLVGLSRAQKAWKKAEELEERFQALVVSVDGRMEVHDTNVDDLIGVVHELHSSRRRRA